MKQHRAYIVFSSLMLVLFSASLMISTLHSHNHIEWHHPKTHVDTGHCLTVDSTVCPICACLFDAEPNPGIDIEYSFNKYEIVDEQDLQVIIDRHSPSLPGRSPPFSA